MTKESIQKTILVNLFQSIIFVFGLFLILLFIFKFKNYSITEDFPLLLASGKYILNNLTIPNHDIFSWTNSNKEWVNYHWLFDILIAQLELTFGRKNLISIFITLIFGIYIFIPNLYSRQNKVPFLFTFLISSVCLFIASVNLSVRAITISSLFISIQFLITSNTILKKNISTQVITLFFMYLFWSNIHMGFFVGLLLLMIELISNYFENKNSLKNDLIKIFIPLLATFINPYGYSKIYEYFFNTIKDSKNLLI